MPLLIMSKNPSFLQNFVAKKMSKNVYSLLAVMSNYGVSQLLAKLYKLDIECLYLNPGIIII